LNGLCFADTARVFPAEPSWLTFKALVLPPEQHTSQWGSLEKLRVVEVDLTTRNWQNEIREILNVDYQDLSPKLRVNPSSHSESFLSVLRFWTQQAKQELQSLTFFEATIVYSGRGSINYRASVMAQQLIRGHALLNFGGFKGKTLHSLLRPGMYIIH